MNQVIASPKAPVALGPYSHAIRTGNRLYLSGQLGINAQTGVMPEDFAEQARLVMDNLGHVLQEAGFGFEDVVKVMIFLDDLANFNTLNGIYAEYFPVIKPARSCVQAAALPKSAKVEIELIAEKN